MDHLIDFASSAKVETVPRIEGNGIFIVFDLEAHTCMRHMPTSQGNKKFKSQLESPVASFKTPIIVGVVLTCT